MWHLAPEDPPAGTAGEIARDLDACLADQDFPWHRPQGSLQVAPAAEGSASRGPSSDTPTRGRSTSCRQARFRPPRPTLGGSGKRGRHNRYRTPGSSRCGTCPWAPCPMPPKSSRGLSTAPTPRRGSPPQPAGGGGLDTPAGGGRAPGPVLPPGAGPGAASRRGHGNRAVGGDRTQQGVQVGHFGSPATHAIATGLPRLLRAVPPLAPRHALTREFGGPC